MERKQGSPGETQSFAGASLLTVGNQKSMKAQVPSKGRTARILFKNRDVRKIEPPRIEIRAAVIALMYVSLWFPHIADIGTRD
jgi:hypothetical protein